jgi:hypothetical protein
MKAFFQNCKMMGLEVRTCSWTKTSQLTQGHCVRAGRQGSPYCIEANELTPAEYENLNTERLEVHDDDLHVRYIEVVPGQVSCCNPLSDSRRSLSASAAPPGSG